ncbi:MAG: YbaB/EbfC family nucleoid-associated protein [Cyclobacteriaceae bacterium]
MMGKVKEAQEKMKEAQGELASITATGSAGGDMVIAEANGLKQIISLQIDDLVANGNDKQMMTDLIIAASNKALEEVSVLAQEHIQKATEGLLPNIPGMDLGNMMK